MLNADFRMLNAFTAARGAIFAMTSARIPVASSSFSFRAMLTRDVPGVSRSNRIAPSTCSYTRTVPFPSNASSTSPQRHSSPRFLMTFRTTGDCRVGRTRGSNSRFPECSRQGSARPLSDLRHTSKRPPNLRTSYQRLRTLNQLPGATDRQLFGQNAGFLRAAGDRPVARAARSQSCPR